LLRSTIDISIADVKLLKFYKLLKKFCCPLRVHVPSHALRFYFPALCPEVDTELLNGND